MSDLAQKVKTGLTAQAQTNKVDPKQIDPALELAKSQVKVPMSDPDYWYQVDANAKKSLQFFEPDQKKFNAMNTQGQARSTQSNIMQTSTPNREASMKKYVTFAEELSLLEKSSSINLEEKAKESESDSVYQGQTREEAAEEIIKKLKKKGCSKNEMAYALVNRLQMDIDCALEIVYGEKGVGDDEEVIPTDPFDLTPKEK